MNDHYPSIEAYTADVEKARQAYRADQAVLDGFCGACEENPREPHRRICGACHNAGVTTP